MTSVAAICRPTGKIVQIFGFGLSRRAQAARRHLIGKRIWDLGIDQDNRERIRDTFFRCEATERDQQALLNVKSVATGKPAAWHTEFVFADEMVLILARLIGETAPDLTGIQAEVLDALVSGEHLKNIPAMLRTSESTVHRALRGLRDKLQADNTHGIVVSAKRFGLW